MMADAGDGELGSPHSIVTTHFPESSDDDSNEKEEINGASMDNGTGDNKGAGNGDGDYNVRGPVVGTHGLHGSRGNRGPVGLSGPTCPVSIL